MDERFAAAEEGLAGAEERVAVAVDRQGRVRQLDATQTLGQTKRTVRVTFGDFGLAVSVSPPPADQTVVPQGITYIPDPSFTPAPPLSPSPAGSG
jgi:hypothetical protein